MKTNGRKTLGLLIAIVSAFSMAAFSQPGGMGGGEGHEPPVLDIAGAAAALGLDEGALQSAFGEPGSGRPDFAAIAANFGVPEDALLEALGVSAERDGQREGEGPKDRSEERPAIDFAAAAGVLGISEDDLLAALGDPGQGRPDLAAAAETLGISEDALIEALGLPEPGENRGGEGAEKGQGGPPRGGPRH